LWIENNVIWGTIQTAVGFNQVVAAVFTNNFVGHTLPRSSLEATGMQTLDVHGGVLICSLTHPKACPGMSITNNIAAGTIFAGFMAPAANCGDS